MFTSTNELIQEYSDKTSSSSSSSCLFVSKTQHHKKISKTQDVTTVAKTLKALMALRQENIEIDS